MATTLHRSPSPISNRTTGNFRSTESNNGLRKSFNSNFLSKPSISAISRSFPTPTPANSPADFPQRNLGFKEGFGSPKVSIEQKENDKEGNRNCSKGIRARSPVVVAKGTKNFMSPTISAASKAAASPRTKVLTERNEIVGGSQVRSDHSAPVFHGKSPFSSMNSSEYAESAAKIDWETNPEEIGSEPNVAFDFDLPNNAKNLSEIHPISKSVDSETELHLDTKSPPVKDPLEPDPSLPPYDPKTNYLSPRPKFLCYKPNPRIELYLNREKVLDIGGEGKRLESSFTSESYSDSEQIGEPQSPHQQKNSEDELSSEEKPEPNGSEEHGFHVSKEEEPENSQVSVQKIPKSSLFLRPKPLHLVLILFIACLSATLTDSPFHGSFSEYRDLSVTKLYAPALHAFTGLELHFRSLQEGKYRNLTDPFAKIAESTSTNYKYWSRNCVSYVSKMLPVLREEEMSSFISSSVSNLTVSDGDSSEHHEQSVDFDQSVNVEDKDESYQIEKEQGNLEIEPNDEIDETDHGVTERNLNGEIDETDPEEQSNLELSGQKDTAKGITEPNFIGEINETVHEEQSNSDLVENENNQNGIAEPNLNKQIHETITEEQSNSVLVENKNIKNGIIEPNLSSKIVEIVIEEQEIIELDPIQCDPGMAETEKTKDQITNAEMTIETGFRARGSEDKFFMQNMIGISSILLTLAAITASFYFKNKNRASVTDETMVNYLLPKKVIPDPVSGSFENHSDFEDLALRLASFYRREAEEEMVGESGPAEMSSTWERSLSSSWRSRKGEGEEKKQSPERRRRRNNSNWDCSAISSEQSAGSPSYGSFTTYEKKVSTKQGCGDGDKVTPVRRSSRIRNQITSP